MRLRISYKSLGVCIPAALLLGVFCAAAQDHIIYSSIPKDLPGNVASSGPEAVAFAELGDGMIFKAGSGGSFQKVAFIMSDWACEHGHWYVSVGSVATNGDGPCVTKPGSKYKQDITLNVYSVSGNVPSFLGSLTETFDVPFRPSSDAQHCGPHGNPGGDGKQWYSDQDKTCYHGFAFRIEFNLNKLPIPIPANNSAIMTVSFNTSDYGPHPQRPQACNSQPAPDNDNCPYDSLNISTDSGGFNNPPTNSVFIGNFLVSDSIFVNYTQSANACAGNTVTGHLAIDPGCWEGFHPQIEVQSTPRTEPKKNKNPDR